MRNSTDVEGCVEVQFQQVALSGRISAMNIKVLAAVLDCANSVRRGSMFDPFWDIKRHILSRFGTLDGFVYQLFPRTCQIVKHRSYVLEGRQFLVPAPPVLRRGVYRGAAGQTSNKLF